MQLPIRCKKRLTRDCEDGILCAEVEVIETDEYQTRLQAECERISRRIEALEREKGALTAELKGLELSLQLYRSVRNQDKPARDEITSGQKATIYKLLEEAFPKGLTLDELTKKAAEKGVILNRRTAESHLSRALSAGQVSKDHLKRFSRFPASE